MLGRFDCGLVKNNCSIFVFSVGDKNVLRKRMRMFGVNQQCWNQRSVLGLCPHISAPTRCRAVSIRKAIANGDCTTARWCADVRAQAEDGTLIPALLIHAEHAHSFSEDILIAYRKNEDGTIVFDEPAVEPTQHQIFSLAPGLS